MSWSAYLSFVAFAGLLVLVPGADFTVIVKNTLAGGAGRGGWSAAGVASSNAVQGLAAVAGLGALVVHYQPLFQAIKWAGIGVPRLSRRPGVPVRVEGAVRRAARERRSAGAGRVPAGVPVQHHQPQGAGLLPGGAAAVHRSVDTGGRAAVLALTHATLSLTYLQLVVTGLHRVRRVLSRRRVRRALDAATDTLLLGFGARLAAESA